MTSDPSSQTIATLTFPNISGNKGNYKMIFGQLLVTIYDGEYIRGELNRRIDISYAVQETNVSVE